MLDTAWRVGAKIDSSKSLSIWGKSNVVQMEAITMQYLLLIYENEKRFSQGYDETEMKEYQAFGKEFAKAIKDGNALQPTATAKTVRIRKGKAAATDGPFAETTEQLGGYYLVDAGDLA